MVDSDVGRNKAIEARSVRWRFRRVREVFAGNAGSRYRSNPLIPAYFWGHFGNPTTLRGI